MTHSAVLWGPDHTRLGSVASAAAGPDIGIALSRGAVAKPYDPVDPNEDGALAVVGEAWLLAVADGHGGFEAAGAALGAVAEAGEALLAAGEQGLVQLVDLALGRAQAAVAAAVANAPDERTGSRTALSVVAGHTRTVVHGTEGDTAVVRIGGRRRPKQLSRSRPFLGPFTQPAQPVTARLRPGERIVAGTDGLVAAFGRRWVDAAAQLCAGLPGPAAATRLVEAALERGVADNVAVAVGPMA